MEVRENGSFAEIWLTNAEQSDPAIMAALGALLKQYKIRSCLPVVYRSGENDLFAGMKDLLLYNKKLASGGGKPGRMPAAGKIPGVQLPQFGA